jgi:cob(I)alamin adenosyltransferase
MKIYTRTGDKGSTSIVGGIRLSKSDPLIEAIGNCDELNSYLGLCAASAGKKLKPYLETVQDELFRIGSALAIPDPLQRKKLAGSFGPDRVKRLESEIDLFTKKLKPLRNFILPGGSEIAARLFVARAVCRRFERSFLRAECKGEDYEIMRQYLNRLSDWLFTLARSANALSGTNEQTWSV